MPALQLKEEGPFFIALAPRAPQEASSLSNERQRQLPHFNKDFFPFSTQDYAKHFKISERTARMDLKELLNNGQITRIRQGRRLRYLLARS